VTDPKSRVAWRHLERIDRDVFRSAPLPWGRDANLFGGLVAGQALAAAAETIPTGRLPHSLHGYYLRRGDPLQPVVYTVDRDRDGRSFSARRVAARQDGEVIWEMSCSFAEPVDGPEYLYTDSPVIPDLDECMSIDFSIHPFLDVRVLAPTKATRPFLIDRAWIRVNEPLDDDPITHACMHTYISDVTSAFADWPGGTVPGAGPSLDHAMWFHHFGRADEWTYHDLSPVKVMNHRGLYTGTLYDAAGRIVAALAQEMLLRPE